MRFERAQRLERAAPQVVRDLQDMRIWRRALKPPAFLDPRHYGPPEGVGARLAVVICHLRDIRRSGVLQVDSATEGQVVFRGEFPPIWYRLSFDVTAEGPRQSLLRCGILATPQPLYPFRILTRLKLGRLEASVAEVFDPLLSHLAEGLMAAPEDPAFHPRVTTDGFVEGPAAAELREGGGMRTRILDRPVALFQIGGRLFAVADHGDDRSPSRGDGTLEGDILTDPRDGRRYDLTTGMAMGGAGSIPTYPARLDGGKIYVRIQLV